MLRTEARLRGLSSSKAGARTSTLRVARTYCVVAFGLIGDGGCGVSMWVFLRAVHQQADTFTHVDSPHDANRLKEGCARTSGKAAEVMAELLSRAAQAHEELVLPGEQLPNITLKECRQIV